MTAAAEDAVELAAWARLLSLGFGRPDEEALADVAALARGLSARSGDADLAVLLAPLDAEALRGEYAALFEGKVRCSPYEGSYEADPFRQAREMADVVGFYRAFGADAAAAQRPDHAGCELEFLAFLALKREEALRRGEVELAERCREAEDSFLRDHLGRWFPTFCRGVAAETSLPFYACLARLGERLVAAELARRGLEPEPLPPRRRLPLEADTFECAGACGTPPGAPVPSPSW